MTQDCREKSPSSDGDLIIKIPKRDLLFYVEIRVPDFSSYYCAVFGVCVCVGGGCHSTSPRISFFIYKMDLLRRLGGSVS